MDDSVLLYANVIPSCKCSPPIPKHDAHLPIKITENTTFYDILEWISAHPFFNIRKYLAFNMQNIKPDINVIQTKFIEKQKIEAVFEIQQHTGGSFRLYVSQLPLDRKFNNFTPDRTKNMCYTCGTNVQSYSYPSFSYNSYYGMFSSNFQSPPVLRPVDYLKSDSLITSHVKRNNNLSAHLVGVNTTHTTDQFTDYIKTPNSRPKNFKPIKQLVKDTKRHQQKINNSVVFKNNRR